MPSRIGIVPYSAVADEEKRIEEEQERKQQHNKGSKATPKAKSASREKSNDKKSTLKKPKVVWVGSTPITPITAQQSRELDRRIQMRKERLRKRYPDVHGRVVDYVSHSIEDGTLFVNVVFKDKTNVSFRFACEMVIVGADFGDTRTGDLEIVREYMKPILR